MLYKLKKKGSGIISISVDTYMDPDDPWFIKIEWKTVNEQKVKRELVIIRSDLESWLESFLSGGWEIVQQSE